MDKLPMCRICMAENVPMYVVVDTNLRELYEKLTNIPFITEDSRPIHACSVCCTQLKRCYQLLETCLKSEELFAQLISEHRTLINQDQFEFTHGFTTPMESISSVDVGLTESIVVKEELPAVCERLDDIIEPKEEHESGFDLKPVNVYDNYLDIHDIPLNHFESHTDNDLPLMDVKARVEEQQNVSKNIQKAEKTNNQETVNYRFTVTNNHLDIEYIAPHRSASDSEDDVPLMQVKSELEEEQEVPAKKRSCNETSSAPVAKEPKLGSARTKLEYTNIAVQQQTDPEMIQDIQNPLKPFIASQTRVQSSSNNTAVDIDQDAKPYKCNICPKTFKHKIELTIHLRTHSGEKPFKCHICLRDFSHKNLLTNHIRTHTGEKPFNCNICTAHFTEKSHLTRHMRTHTGEKPFKCDICQCSFSHKSTLIGHKRTHSDEKPFKCQICSTSFKEKEYLNKHIRIHTGEKPFKCNVCQRAFSRKDYVTSHMRIHTGVKPSKAK